MKIEVSQRIKKLPPYLFAEIDKSKRQAIKEGRDIIDIGIGDPDFPTPDFLIKELYSAANNPANHRYALDLGKPKLREAISDWYKERFNAALDPQKEVLPLIGSKEGIAHFPLAFVNPGDYTLVPSPCYPPYRGGTIFAGGRVHDMPLLSENNFLPDLKKIPTAVLKKAKIIYLNYPNNPTSAIAPKEFLKEVVAFALRRNLIIVYDNAYSEISFDGYKAPSILEIKGAMGCAIEFHSLSKTFNMTGWRIGWACGNSAIISALGKVKANIDSGIFSAIQDVGIAALKSGNSHIQAMTSIYQSRRDRVLSGLAGIGLPVNKPKATFYIWVRVPKKFNSITFASLLLNKANIVVTPGVGFGKYGEGYFRIALTVKEERLIEAIERIKKCL